MGLGQVLDAQRPVAEGTYRCQFRFPAAGWRQVQCCASPPASNIRLRSTFGLESRTRSTLHLPDRSAGSSQRRCGRGRLCDGLVVGAVPLWVQRKAWSSKQTARQKKTIKIPNRPLDLNGLASRTTLATVQVLTAAIDAYRPAPADPCDRPFSVTPNVRLLSVVTPTRDGNNAPRADSGIPPERSTATSNPRRTPRAPAPTRTSHAQSLRAASLGFTSKGKVPVVGPDRE